MAQIALLRTDVRTEALRGIIGELLAMDGPRRHLGGMMSGLEIRYDLGEGHPLLGRRMPDRDLATPGGATRVYELLRSARGVMLGFASHLVLDEVYSVDWRGVRPKLKSSAGTAFKLGSSSLAATATCYAILGGLLWLAYKDSLKPVEEIPDPPARYNRRVM